MKKSSTFNYIFHQIKKEEKSNSLKLKLFKLSRIVIKKEMEAKKNSNLTKN
jgi:hypothetical protein